MHAHDLTLQTERLGRYQRLFHLSGRLPRYWRPGEESKTLRDLASERRHQLGEDIGAASPPRVSA